MKIEYLNKQLDKWLSRELRQLGSAYKIQTGLAKWIEFVFKANRKLKIENRHFVIELKVPVYNSQKDFMTLPTECILVLNNKGIWLEFYLKRCQKHLSVQHNGLKELFPIQPKENEADIEFLEDKIYNLTGILCLYDFLTKHKLHKESIRKLTLD